VSDELVFWITESIDYDLNICQNDLQLKILLGGYMQEGNCGSISVGMHG
jgi:hypothetical protein